MVALPRWSLFLLASSGVFGVGALVGMMVAPSGTVDPVAVLVDELKAERSSTARLRAELAAEREARVQAEARVGLYDDLLGIVRQPKEKR